MKKPIDQRNRDEENKLNEAVEALLEKDEVYEQQATELVSAEQLRERHKEEIKTFLRDGELKLAIGRGFELIRRDIIEVLEEEQLDTFFDELSKINSRALDDPSPEVQKKLDEGRQTLTFQEVFELSNESLKQIYKLGYQYFQKQCYDDAIDIFSIVTTLNPFVADFWNAMALCFQAKQEWNRALDTFAIACTLNENDLTCRISRAECCINLKQMQEASQELDLAKGIIENNPALDETWGEYLRDLKSQI